MTRTLSLIATLSFVTACQSDDKDPRIVHEPTPGTADAGAASIGANDGDGSDGPLDGAPRSFYADVLPLLEQRCVGCHQEGGIAPFALDSFDAAATWADAIAEVTADRSMPPWSALSDGTCGTFSDSIALTDSEIATFGEWAQPGMNTGESRETELPNLPQLQDATTLATPVFSPQPEGTADAENDEYRCFVFDAPNDALQFITGYSVNPGTAELVHHLVAFIVEPSADSEIEGKSNAEVMAELDAVSPERDGWSCFGAAGDGVAVQGVPAVWAPGQGVVAFPAGSGTPLAPTNKLVVQIHYNLEDPRSLGKSDSTELRLRLSDSVERVGLFVVPDPFLDSYFDGEPLTLEPGKKSVKFEWTQTLADLGLDGLPDVQLAGIMPHMHELGHRYEMRVEQGDSQQCGVSVNEWDFHWQRMYFYQQAIPLPPGSSLAVTCDYDTSSRSEPVLPGWGTQNEMCAAILYVTAPISAFSG